jgi:hypothetical protein
VSVCAEGACSRRAHSEESGGRRRGPVFASRPWSAYQLPGRAVAAGLVYFLNRQMSLACAAPPPTETSMDFANPRCLRRRRRHCTSRRGRRRPEEATNDGGVAYPSRSPDGQRTPCSHRRRRRSASVSAGRPPPMDPRPRPSLSGRLHESGGSSTDRPAQLAAVIGRPGHLLLRTAASTRRSLTASCWARIPTQPEVEEDLLTPQSPAKVLTWRVSTCTPATAR